MIMPELVPTGAAEERAAFLHPRDMPGVEILHVDGATREWKGVLDTYSVSLPVGGAGRLRYRRESVVGEAGCLALLEPGEYFSCAPAAEATAFRVVRFEPALLAEAAGLERGVSPGLSFREILLRRGDVTEQARRFHAAFVSPASMLERQSLFASLLRGLIEGACERAALPSPRHVEHRGVRRAREYLHAHFADPVSLDQLAAEAGLNKFYLLQIFKEALGSPPHEYQTYLRMERARALLAAGWSATSVAVEVGFGDQSHFHRHFRRLYGMTPGAYARAC